MNIKKYLLTAASVLALATSAHAGFINGGFETGDFTGWTLEHGLTYGSGVTYTAGSAGHAYVIGPTADPYSPFDTPFNGKYMARLNEWTSPNYDATRISQTATMLTGETDLFINWASVMEDPSHPVNQEPAFSISIVKNGVEVASENHNASQGTAGGWTKGAVNGPAGSPIYYSSGTFHIAGLLTGDIVSIVLTSYDCGQGAHVGYAYLDGIGTTYQPPVGVPDGGATVALLGLALVGFAAVRRKMSQA